MGHKFLMGHTFMKAMIDAGLVPDKTSRIDITVEIGEPITMNYTVFGDERLLDIVSHIETTDSGTRAGTAQ